MRLSVPAPPSSSEVTSRPLELYRAMTVSIPLPTAFLASKVYDPVRWAVKAYESFSPRVMSLVFEYLPLAEAVLKLNRSPPEGSVEGANAPHDIISRHSRFSTFRRAAFFSEDMELSDAGT
jgi:hypothetical protein